MKKLLISSLIVLLFSSVGYSQSRKGLVGPKAKNYQPFRNNNSVPGLVIEPQKKVTGPEAKNAKPWDEREEVLYATNYYGQQREKLIGPKAKNAKPWVKNEEVVLVSK